MKRLKIILQSNQFYLFFFLFLAFYVLFFTKIIRYQTKYPDTTKEIIGKIVSYSIDGDKLSLIIKSKEKITATYYIQSEEEKLELTNTLKIGMKLKLIGEKKEILGRTIPNTFNYKSYLYHEKIYFCFTISKIEIFDNSIGVLNSIKNKLDERIKRIGNNAYLRAFVLGDKTLIDNEEYENIKKNGVSHLFALSGMHLSLLYLFFDKILKKRKYKKGIIYLILLLYLYCTGCSISFSRAILFLFLLDSNKKWNLKISKIKILFLTAFFLLLFNPFIIYNIGFWYTFVVTFSLLFCNNFLNNRKKGVQIILVSTITFLFSLPISIYLNYEINLLSIFNNILLVPFISTFIFPLALFSFLFPIFLPIFQFFIQILEKLNFLFVNIELPIVFGKISLLEVFVCYLFLILGFLLKYKKIFVFLFLFLVFLYNKNLFQRDYSVYFLDVGQGDATLFVAPKNKEVILIDTGGSIKTQKNEYQKRNKEFDLADNIVLFLKSKRIRKIDLLLITHGGV